jgi:hypothetical protein
MGSSLLALGRTKLAHSDNGAHQLASGGRTAILDLCSGAYSPGSQPRGRTAMARLLLLLGLASLLLSACAAGVIDNCPNGLPDGPPGAPVHR